ncbi:MAG: lipopolysaccharide biosynthesis protein [Deltaproteobacteria bacterium]|nr:lipopolysaccharide biosynthesis protein [Deltaproteobacteria bacterium]
MMSGAMLAQAVNLAVTPVLTRLFTPSDFGVLKLVNSFAALFIGVAALRFDMAIVLPKRESHGAGLLALSLTCVAFTTGLAVLVVLLGGGWLADALGGPGLESWLWLAPPIILVTGAYNALTYWCTRQAQFGRLSISAATAGLSSAGAKLVGGAARLGALGLTGGQLLGQAVAALVLGAQVWRSDRAMLRLARFSRFRALAKSYRDFPFVHAPMTLINRFVQTLPVFMLGTYFGEESVGQWALCMVLVAVPVQVLQNAFRQVVFQRMSARVNEGGDVVPLLNRSHLGLFLVGILPATVGSYFAPEVLPWILGFEWTGAGHMARFAIWWQLSLLVSTPALALFPVLRMQRAVLVWQVGGLALCAGVLYFAASTGDAVVLMAHYSYAMVALNVVFIVMVSVVARGGASAARS